jgi:hypothetical protein
MSSPSSPDSQKPKRTADAEPSSEQIARSDPALLEKVVLQTLDALGSAAQSADSIDVQRLRTVAHRRRGQPLTLEPVAIELVRAILGPDFGGLGDQPELFLSVSAQVARALMDDPSACRRLENLWARLCET